VARSSASGGIEIVYSGGTTSNTTVSNGGTLELFSGAIASGAIIGSGGILEIGSGYTTSKLCRKQRVVTLEVAAGGIASGTTVLSGGTPRAAERRHSKRHHDQLRRKYWKSLSGYVRKHFARHHGQQSCSSAPGGLLDVRAPAARSVAPPVAERRFPEG